MGGIIPASVKRFTAGKNNLRSTVRKTPLIYGGKGEEINVLRWVRWPCYDFIFGAPAKTSKYYKDEYGFFQYRDTRKSRRGSVFYVDVVELRELVSGFSTLLRLAENRTKREG